MLNFKCDICSKNITNPGALVFSPPKVDAKQNMMVVKYHLCVDCYETQLLRLLKGHDAPQTNKQKTRQCK